MYKKIESFMKQYCGPAMIYFLIFLYNIIYYMYVFTEKIVRKPLDNKSKPVKEDSKKTTDNIKSFKILLIFEFFIYLFVSLMILSIIILLCKNNYYKTAWAGTVVFGLGWTIYQLTRTA